MRNYRPSPFWPFVRGVIFTIVILICLVMCSCSPKPSKEVGWMADMSVSQVNLNREDAAKMHDHLIRNVFQIEGESDYSGGIKCYIVVMGESARPRIRLVYLEPGKSSLLTTTKDRAAKVQAFKEELLQALEEMVSGELNQNGSNLHHAICYLSKVMRESNFSHDKSIYCFSDGMENSHVENFMEYHDKLESFEENFPTISDKLNKDCALPDMTGIEFNLFNSPDAPMGPIVLSCARFWQYHTEQAGATFRVRSNLSF